MTSEITNSLRQAAEAVTGNGSKEGAQSSLGSDGTESKKIKDLQRDMIDVHSSQPMTTDFGHKISDTDNWLKIASDKSTGPHLLEDQQAREKASAAALSTSSSDTPVCRFIASIMSAFLSVSFTPADLLLLANSRSSKARQM
jgi:hypothetical protein